MQKIPSQSELRAWAEVISPAAGELFSAYYIIGRLADDEDMLAFFLSASPADEEAIDDAILLRAAEIKKQRRCAKKS